MTVPSSVLDTLFSLLTLLEGRPGLRLALALAAWSALALLLGCAVSARLRRAVWRRKWLAACWLLLALLGATLSAWPQLRRLLLIATPADDPLSLTLPWSRTLAGLSMPAGTELTLPAPGSYAMLTGLGGRPDLVFFESARFPQPVSWRGLRITAIGGRLAPASADPAPGGSKNSGKHDSKGEGKVEGRNATSSPMPVWAQVLPLELAEPAFLDGWHCAAGPVYLMRPTHHAPDAPAVQPAPDDWQLAHCILASAYRILPAADATGLLPSSSVSGNIASALTGNVKEGSNRNVEGVTSRVSANEASGSTLGATQGMTNRPIASASASASNGALINVSGSGPTAWVELPAGTRLWRSQTFDPDLDAPPADGASYPGRGRRVSRPARDPRQPQWLLVPPDDAAIIAPHFALGGSAWQLNAYRRLLRWQGQVLANDIPQSERDAAESEAARAELARQAREHDSVSDAGRALASAVGNAAPATAASAASSAPEKPSAPDPAPEVMSGLCPLPLGSWLSSGETGTSPGTWQLLNSCTATEDSHPEPIQCGGKLVQVQPCRWLNWERG